MKRFGILSTAVVALVAMTAPSAPAGASPDRPGGSSPSAPALVAKPIITSLPDPAAFTFLPDGRLLYGERASGNIMLYDLSTKQTTKVFTVTKVVQTASRVCSAWP